MALHYLQCTAWFYRQSREDDNDLGVARDDRDNTETTQRQRRDINFLKQPDLPEKTLLHVITAFYLIKDCPAYILFSSPR